MPLKAIPKSILGVGWCMRASIISKSSFSNSISWRSAARASLASPTAPETQISSLSNAPDLRIALSFGMLPKAVMQILSGPAVVSPPMRGQANWLAIANKPLLNASNQTEFASGNANASVKPSGLAPIAARSERLTARAFQPSHSGLASWKKCLPLTNMSLVIAISSVGSIVSRAQSSPIPIFTEPGLLASISSDCILKKRWIRSNSPSEEVWDCMPHFMALGTLSSERNRIKAWIWLIDEWTDE